MLVKLEELSSPGTNCNFSEPLEDMQHNLADIPGDRSNLCSLVERSADAIERFNIRSRRYNLLPICLAANVSALDYCYLLKLHEKQT